MPSAAMRFALLTCALVVANAAVANAAAANAAAENTVAAQPAPTVVSTPDTTVAVGLDLPEEDWEDYLSGCSLLCAIGWTTTASSVLAPQGANRYAAEEAEDGDLRSAWVEGADGPGLGEHLTMTLGHPDEDLPDDFVTSLWGLRAVTGYAKSAQTWAANGRVRHLEVRVNGRPVTVVALNDTAMLQEATWDGVEVRAGDRIDLVVRSVYPGSRYDDTALSEVLLLGAH